MRFKCKPQAAAYPTKAAATVAKWREWHHYFAWLPVEIENGQCAWLERVERICPTAFVGPCSGLARKSVKTNDADIRYRSLVWYP